MSKEPRKRVLILGGGHAGTATARRLIEQATPEDGLDITLVSRDNALLWHGLMPQIVSGVVRPEDTQVSLRSLLPGATIYSYEIQNVDLETKQVTLNRGAEAGDLVVDADYLVLALGSVTDVSRVPGLVEHGLPVKTMGDVFHLRNHLIDMLELASVETDPAERKRMLTFLVIGAGFAGVEVCTEMFGFLQECLKLYTTIQPSEIHVILLEHAPRILGPISEDLAARVQQHLFGMGIDVRVSTDLADATASGVLLSSGEQIPTHTIIAAVGTGPNPLLATMPLTLARGRIPCNQYCQVEGLTRIYAAGDNAAIPDPSSGNPFPPTLVSAQREGTTIADNILAEIRGGALTTAGSEHMQLALFTATYGVFQRGGLKLDGFLASLIWRGIFLSYIPLWHRRVILALSWIMTALTPRDPASMQVSRTDAILPMRFQAGDTIIRQGERGSRFYIVTEGEVEVSRVKPDGQPEVLNHLGPGQFFGEVALLRHAQRTATVKATKETEVLSVARGDFTTLVKHLTALRDSIESTAQARESTL